MHCKLTWRVSSSEGHETAFTCETFNRHNGRLGNMTAQLWNADVTKILESLRGKLNANGAQQLSDLRLHFAQMDWKGEGFLGRKEVEVCLNHFGLFPTSQELGTLLRVYGSASTGTTSPQLAWAPFVDALESRLSATCRGAVRQAYESIGRRSNNRLSVDELASLGRFEQHPLALRGITPASVLAREFAIGLAKAQATTTAAYYHTICHAIANEQDFLSMMQGVWDVDELKVTPQVPLFGGHKTALVRKLEAKTHDTELPREVLVRVLKKFDKQEKGSLTQSEFAQAIEVFGFILTPQQLNDTFQRGETDKAGKLNLAWFADFICT
ncbi:hypothetical protein, variant [Aphanomyces astaci]|uniref:EF-hand domain-containing protein n=1 Tax=Aphanomyces astaci TaxID=112090 RepID=W4GY54_APHAT|nr:hypothetical protein, variant [Aphanomyces astaci]ETV84572.1 hypothetical protein, variant [Aphanomyces astaci]|eukprot:XP_009826264.1 hypothetical protein, variant [Aphanomyces astaci]